MFHAKAALAGWLLAVCSLAAWPAAGAAPLRIGFICPASGGSADFGTSALLGAELAVQEINEVGGFLGRPLELVPRDDRSDPAEGRRISEGLVLREQVAFTVGFCNTGVALQSLDVFERHRHLLMVPVATGSAITARTPAPQSFVFRMSARDRLQAAFIVEEIARRGLRRVALLADSTGYGQGGFDDVTRLLADKGLEPVYTARFPVGVSSLAQPLREARAAGADAVVAYTVGPEFALVARGRAEAGLAAPLFGPWPASLRTVWNGAGRAAEGVMMVQTIIADVSSERRTGFIARLRRHAGDRPVASLMAAAQTYDAVHLMLRALFQTRGDTSGPALKAALEHLERAYVGVVTTHDRPFTPEDHDAFSINMVWLGVWRDGEVRFLRNEDARLAATARRKQPQ